MYRLRTRNAELLIASSVCNRFSAAKAFAFVFVVSSGVAVILRVGRGGCGGYISGTLGILDGGGWGVGGLTTGLYSCRMLRATQWITSAQRSEQKSNYSRYPISRAFIAYDVFS